MINMHRLAMSMKAKGCPSSPGTFPLPHRPEYRIIPPWRYRGHSNHLRAHPIKTGGGNSLGCRAANSGVPASFTENNTMHFSFVKTFEKMGRVIAHALALVTIPIAAFAQTDSPGPDIWRVDGVASNDTLNVRMGPGTHYPAIDSFSHDERGLRLITCVPFFGHGGGAALSDAQRADLPPRWCLMQHSDPMRAGWVAQRYIAPDDAAKPDVGVASDLVPDLGDAPIAEAEDLVRALYDMHTMALMGLGPSPLDPALAGQFFFADVVDHLRTNPLQVDPLFNAQDFDGSIEEPYRDPQHPMLRGMITVLVDFTNFGQPQRATVRLRVDTGRPDRPIRIMRIEHDGWTFP